MSPHHTGDTLKFLNIVSSVRSHPDFAEKYSDNLDPFSRDLAFAQIMKDVMLERRKEELGLYKLHNKYSALKVALYKSIKDLIWADEPRGQTGLSGSALGFYLSDEYLKFVTFKVSHSDKTVQ